MVETMSTVHTHASSKNGHGHANTSQFIQRRFLRGVTYPRGHPQDLSSIKLSKSTSVQDNLQEEWPSSESSKVTYFKHSPVTECTLTSFQISNNSSSRRTCDPLPAWLASTIMALSRKHPLQLLLPPGFNSDETNALSSMGTASAQPESVFAQRSCYSPPQSTYTVSKTFAGSTRAAKRNLSSSPSLYFSTPGPVYMLKDNPASIPSPKPCSSSTLYSADICIGADPSVLDSFVPNYCSDNEDSTLFGAYNDNTDDSASDPLPHDLANSHLFLDIFATPGPGYCASRIEYFDSPTEDPSEFGSLAPELGKDYEDIDFQWKPFDRKELVVPAVSDQISFAYARSKKHLIRDGEVQDLINSVNFLKTRDRASLTRNALSSPVSPNPFRFTAPAEDGPLPVISPQSQEQSKQLTTPRKPPFVPVPGIYLPPLASSGSHCLEQDLPVRMAGFVSHYSSFTLRWI